MKKTFIDFVPYNLLGSIGYLLFGFIVLLMIIKLPLFHSCSISITYYLLRVINESRIDYLESRINKLEGRNEST